MKSHNIQILRAVAAMCVVFLHSGFRLFGLQPFGRFGVDVFFVISGFIMAMIVNGGAGKFFARRLIRILPLYWTATVVAFLIACVAPELLKSTRPDVTELVKSLLFIPFRKESGLLRPILFLGWTLNFEMFFYTVIAVSLLVYRKRALLVTALMIVAVVLTCALFKKRSAVAEFYSNPVALEFIFGMLAFRWHTRVPAPFVKRYRAALSIAACAAILALIWMEEVLLTPVWPARAAAFGGASFVIVLSIALLSRNGFDLKWKWLVAIGDASYALYIIHPYIEYGLVYLSRKAPWLSPQQVPGLLLTLAVTTLSSILVHRKFERPITGFLSRKLTAPHRVKDSFCLRSSATPGTAPV